MTERVNSPESRSPSRSASLHQRAIIAAMLMLEADGPEALSVRDIARRLGGGVASLYYHFKNKDALLAELAADGFRLLQQEFYATLRADRSRSAIQARGRAYLHFIRDHPMLYRLMYSEPILAQHKVAQDAEQGAFKAFAETLAAMRGASSTDEDGAFALWALARGISSLTLSAGPPGNPSTKEITAQVVRGLEAMMGHSLRTEPPLV